MRVLVIGGCGFIGSHIVDQLLNAGYSVRVFDRYPEKFRAPLQGVEYVFGDIRDPMAIIEAMTNVGMVMHLVSTTFPGTADLDPQADVRDNILPTLNLLETMVKFGVTRLLYLSSGGTVYGIPDQVPTPETHPLRPINSYGIVKTAIEHYLELYRRTRGISPIIIRPSNPYGPRQGHTGVQGVVATFLSRILHKEPIEIWGDGSVVRDYLYVEDLARLCVMAAASDKTVTCNGGSGRGTALSEIVARLQEVTGVALDPVYRPGRAVDVPHSILDISLSRKEFDWKPEVDLAQGLTRTWDWLRTVRT